MGQTNEENESIRRNKPRGQTEEDEREREKKKEMSHERRGRGGVHSLSQEGRSCKRPCSSTLSETDGCVTLLSRRVCVVFVHARRRVELRSRVLINLCWRKCRS